MAGVYVPRSPTTSVLYGVVRTHWSEFAATVRERTDGVGLPSVVVSEFWKFLRCGMPSISSVASRVVPRRVRGLETRKRPSASLRIACDRK
jgi:hypothetical protein